MFGGVGVKYHLFFPSEIVEEGRGEAGKFWGSRRIFLCSIYKSVIKIQLFPCNVAQRTVLETTQLLHNMWE